MQAAVLLVDRGWSCVVAILKDYSQLEDLLCHIISPPLPLRSSHSWTKHSEAAMILFGPLCGF